MKATWLDRRIASPGPYLTLCLSEPEFRAALAHLGIQDESQEFCLNEWSNATVHFVRSPKQGLCAIVCLKGREGRHPIEVAGLLVHEAVHIWQRHAREIGEDSPGDEQEAYAIQSISQELMAEFSRRVAAAARRACVAARRARPATTRG